METKVNNEVLDLEVVAGESQKLAITGDVRAELVAQLGEVKARIPMHVSDAERMVVQSVHDAAYADEKLAAIMADEKIISDKSGVLAGLIESANRFHKTLTGWRATFTDPLAEAKRKIKAKRDEYTRIEAEKAAREQARLQAEADAKARREQEALLKKAETLKTPEKQEEYRQAAAAVVAPQIFVAAPAARKGAQKRWFVKSVDKAAFVKAVIANPMLIGYITIDEAGLVKTKAANAAFDVPGVVFEQRTV